jgi:hypothetical protein
VGRAGQRRSRFIVDSALAVESHRAELLEEKRKIEDTGLFEEQKPSAAVKLF